MRPANLPTDRLQPPIAESQDPVAGQTPLAALAIQPNYTSLVASPSRSEATREWVAQLNGITSARASPAPTLPTAPMRPAGFDLTSQETSRLCPSCAHGSEGPFTVAIRPSGLVAIAVPRPLPLLLLLGGEDYCKVLSVDISVDDATDNPDHVLKTTRNGQSVSVPLGTTTVGATSIQTWFAIVYALEVVGGAACQFWNTIDRDEQVTPAGTTVTTYTPPAPDAGVNKAGSVEVQVTKVFTPTGATKPGTPRTTTERHSYVRPKYTHTSPDKKVFRLYDGPGPQFKKIDGPFKSGQGEEFILINNGTEPNGDYKITQDFTAYGKGTVGEEQKASYQVITTWTVKDGLTPVGSIKGTVKKKS